MPEKQMEQEEGKKRRKNGSSYVEQDEETDEYMEWPSERASLNEAKSVFDKGTFGGINTDKSVFEKTAVFHTERSV